MPQAISRSRVRLANLLTAILLITATLSSAQKVNPNTGINWPMATGSGAPSAGGCTSANYGQPYTNLATSPNQEYVCGVVASTPTWVVSGGSTGLTGSANLTGQVAVYVNGALQSFGNPFAMTMSCSAAGAFEIGKATTNPNTCTFAYSNGTVASGTLSDGTNTTTLTTPFTTGALAYGYTTNTTFTGHATATNTQTASATASFTVGYCTFAGLGTGGTATGVTASGTLGAANCASSETAFLSGATATLSNNGLGNTFAGQIFTLSPAGQYIYLFLTGGCGHTIKVGGFVTVFNTTAISSYTNLAGGAQAGMCIYSSPTYVTGSSLQVQVSAL